MRLYAKAVNQTAVTFVDIDTGEKFNAAVTTLQKLFGEVPQPGDVWDCQARRLDDVAENFRRWQVVDRA